MIKRLAKCIREYKKDAILTPILVAVECAFEVIIPLIMAKLIDYGIDSGDMGAIWKYGIILLLASVVSLAGGVGAGMTAANASAGFAKNLRHDMFYNVQTFSFANIDKFSTGSIITRLTTDISNVQMAFQMIIRGAARAPLMLIFSLVAAFTINAKLAMVFLATVPFMAIALAIIMKTTFPVFEKMFKTYDGLNNRVGENLHGIRVVKIFVQEQSEISRFKETSQKIFKLGSRAEKNIAYNLPVMQACVYFSLLFISWFGARAIVASGGDPVMGMSTGQLMSMLSYVMQIMMALMFISMIFVMVTIAKTSADRICELLDEKSTLTNPENPVCEVPDGSISFKNVAFSYYDDENKLALKNITIDIPSGETVGIIGGTGSGKSSFVQLIPRLYDVTGGSVEVGGRDVREYDIESLRSEVAMVLQKNELFSGTVRSNLLWGDKEATDDEIRRACELAQAQEFIDRMENGYDTTIEQGGTNVSGGQKQRLTIARALLCKPKILILDDSTSAVDVGTDALIRQAFRTEIPNTTKLIIAQRISSVQDADRIIVMDEGGINAVGTHNELLEKCEIYREIYESQVKGGLGDE
ncbi:MAG: ABC transporter ATP-binding protein [Firmicutes bacterium]|nr:ABC transporter ATP-binding protein [Bacillota bacterium]